MISFRTLENNPYFPTHSAKLEKGQIIPIALSLIFIVNAIAVYLLTFGRINAMASIAGFGDAAIVCLSTLSILLTGGKKEQERLPAVKPPSPSLIRETQKVEVRQKSAPKPPLSPQIHDKIMEVMQLTGKTTEEKDALARDAALELIQKDLYIINDQKEETQPRGEDSNNLSFGLSSSDSKEFTQQILGISAEANGQRPFGRLKSARGASKLPEGEGVKPKTQVNISLGEAQERGITIEPWHTANGRVVILKNAKLLEERDEEGRTPLYLAIDNGLTNTADYLTSCGADITKGKKNGDQTELSSYQHANSAGYWALTSRMRHLQKARHESLNT